MLDTLVNIKHDKRVNLLLASLEDKLKGRITQEVLTDNCYRWSYHYALLGLKYKEIPQASQAVLHLIDMRYKERNKLLERAPDLRFKYTAYLEEVRKVKFRNAANQRWLEDMLKHFEEKKEEAKLRYIKEILYEHQAEVDKV